MGFSFSKPQSRSDEETEALLQEGESLPTPVSSAEAIIDVVAALNAGKLPSQSQLNIICQKLLESGWLDTKRAGRLGGSMTEVLRNSRELVKAVRNFGVRKNYDDKIQEFVYHLYDLSPSAVGFSVNSEDPSGEAADEPSEAMKDAQQLIAALRRTIRLVLTSSVYRTLLSDLLSAFSSILVETAQDVKIAAVKVQTTAEAFEMAARRDELTGDDVDDVVRDARGVQGDLRKTRDGMYEKGGLKAKWIFVGRLQQILLSAHDDKRNRDALRTLLKLFRKYAKEDPASQHKGKGKADEEVDDGPQYSIWTDESLVMILQDLKLVLERAAGGHSLDEPIRLVHLLLADFKSDIKVGNAPKPASPGPPSTDAPKGNEKPENEVAGTSESSSEKPASADQPLSSTLDSLSALMAEFNHPPQNDETQRGDTQSPRMPGGLDSKNEPTDTPYAPEQTKFPSSSPPPSSPSLSHTASPFLEQGDPTVFDEFGEWLNHALANASFINSPESRYQLEVLYDNLQDQLYQSASGSGPDASPDGSQPEDWKTHLRQLFSSLSSFQEALSNDKTTQNLLSALTTLTRSLTQFSIKSLLTADVLAWLVSRFIDVMKNSPMPRVEFVSPLVELAVDGLLVRPSDGDIRADVRPDHIRVENNLVVEADGTQSWDYGPLDEEEDEGSEDDEDAWKVNDGEEAWVIAENDEDGVKKPKHKWKVESKDRTKVHMDGLRLCAKNVGYYFLYKGFIGYEDWGFASLDIGKPGAIGEGAIIDIEIETSDIYGPHSHLDSQDPTPDRAFTVIDVKVDLPGLKLSLEQNKHWFWQPFSHSILRRVLRSLLEAQVRAGLELLSDVLARVNKGVRSRGQDFGEGGLSGMGVDMPSIEDWLIELGSVVGSMKKPPSVETKKQRGETGNEGDGGKGGDRVEKTTVATMKGIVKTTKVFDTSDDSGGEDLSSASPKKETSVAVGFGPMVVADKGPMAVDREAWSSVQDEVAKDVANAQDRAKDMMRMRKELVEKGRRAEAREAIETMRDGWRSDVFNF